MEYPNIYPAAIIDNIIAVECKRSSKMSFHSWLGRCMDHPSKKERWKGWGVCFLLFVGAPILLYLLMRFAERELEGGGITIFTMIWWYGLFMWERYSRLKYRASRVVDRLLDEDGVKQVLREAEFRREQIKKGEWQREEGAERISWFG